MVDGLRDSTGSGGLARAAIESALKRQAARLGEMRERAGGLDGASAQPADGSGFAKALERGLDQVEDAVGKAENLHVDVLRGQLDFHEVAAQLKQSELAFDFAMQVRNKLIDAYREVMRMSV